MFETFLQYWPVVFAATIALLAFSFYWEERQLRVSLEARFKVVVDADAEARRVVRKANVYARKIVDEATSTRDELFAEAGAVRTNVQMLREEYSQKRTIYDRLLREIAVFDDRLAFAELGLYEPHYEFTDSEQFKAEIGRIRAQQKELITSGTAVVCAAKWSVDGSRSKGKAMSDRNIKLVLRAFNGECDAAIANVRWNNAVAMEKRITRVREQLDKLNEKNTISISGDYLHLKLQELRLAHEHREKIKQEKEDRSESARLAREEQKLLRDLENAQEQEAKYEMLLTKAKAEAAKIHGDKLEAYHAQIRTLEKDLFAARAKAERAQSMAEKTTSGYVYIISNVGSFGEDVVKIGLTRRLDPLDRVRELGDASVPFTFDTHAIIYCENAPALERALHSEFDSVRINAQNYRKEFFRVSLDEVEKAVTRLAPEAPFFKDIEAQEYRETLSRRLAALTVDNAEHEKFPLAI